MIRILWYSVNLVFVFLCFSVPAFAAKKSTDDLDCVIEPNMTVELSSPVQGVLEDVLVKRGDSVKKGQVLARLKSGVDPSRDPSCPPSFTIFSRNGFPQK